ncbi:preprotein translocase subunit SecG [Rhodobacteraceae bacterium WD3A24]|nr:preprotein translocase subunit SecG [Rhodobacteraceae bacterium WD3A24]
MENVVLVIHLLLALALIAVVLLQRSEGGGLGMGGGGGGAASSRPPLSGLGKLTWGFAAAFIATSLVLTILAAQNASDGSVVDRMGIAPPPGTEAEGDGGVGDLLPPPSADGGGDGTAPSGDAPLTPPRAE